MDKEERVVFASSLFICLCLVLALYLMAFEAGALRSRGELILTGHAEVKAGLERIQTQNALAYAVSEDSKSKAVESARRMRELADSMQVNPFKGNK